MHGGQLKLDEPSSQMVALAGHGNGQSHELQFRCVAANVASD
jgi:hypothetical protein